ncbi:hypothetical protein ACOSQ3_002408 [Xanthoceras sorbifolium]
MNLLFSTNFLQQKHQNFLLGLLYDRIQVIRDPKTSVVPDYQYWSNGLVKEEALIKNNYEILSKS